jgi:16S rRNA (guanine527-N7)-methyltransferase
MQIWSDLAARANLTLDENTHSKLSAYLDLLIAGNERMNLTRIVDRPSAEVRHVADALTVLPFLPETPHSLADVGTGGGVPGIPLAIVRPDVRVTLIEATKKKAVFLKETAAFLGLTNVTVLDDRAEEIGLGPRREGFDVAVNRAVATMSWLIEWCLPLVKVGGRMLSMKGPKVAEELPVPEWARRALGGGVPVVTPVELPGADNQVIVRIDKVSRTDVRFPRGSSVAKGRPLDGTAKSPHPGLR